MIVTTWLNNVADPHYGGNRPADWAQLSVLATTGDNPVTVITDCFDEHPSNAVAVYRVESMGGNPYFDRWRQFRRWLIGCDDYWVWSTDANDVAMLNDPYPDWLEPDMLYVGSEPVDGPNARSVGFWWMRAVHPDHVGWIATHAHLPLLNAGLLGGTPTVLREFVRDLVEALDFCPNDVTEMAAVNRVLYEQWEGRYVTGDWHTPMWSFMTAHPTAIWAHK